MADTSPQFPSKPAPEPPPPPADAIELAPGVKIPESALRFQYARSRGPGGQNVNKVNTKAELWIALTAIRGLTESAVDRLREIAGKRITAAGEIHVAADSERSQEQNRLAAMERLRAMIEAAVHEPKRRRKTKPSRASRRRRLEAKRHRGEIKSGRRGGGKEE
ncbi:MAG TPA: alternative ribosome rescue aminoacyl-tRNA hydrolase ArfB [Tepidisphaeraceae bacterium]|jgi:ribosome-associated protein|nr:alternative ribosome rescue aminoacyl-tRNA hydrolase ArfB [Tepidisphaeraceae bacterium]